MKVSVIPNTLLNNSAGNHRRQNNVIVSSTASHSSPQLKSKMAFKGEGGIWSSIKRFIKEIKEMTPAEAEALERSVQRDREAAEAENDRLRNRYPDEWII